MSERPPRDDRAMIPVDPPELVKPRGYSHGMLAPPGGRHLMVAGQVAWNRDGELVGKDFAVQLEQALSNVLAVVRAAGGGPQQIGRLTLYVTDKQEYLDRLPEVGEAYRRVMGRHYPAMALVEVAALVEPGAKIEIAADAVVPAPAGGERSDG